MRIFAGFVFSWLLCAAACGQNEQKESVLPMIEAGVHVPVVEVMVNGKGPFRFGIDTGAQGYARVSPELAKKLSLAKIGEVGAHDDTGKNVIASPLYKFESLKIGSEVLTDVRANQMLPVQGGALMPIDGMLGFRAFENTVVKIDYPNRQVVLSGKRLQKSDPNVAVFDLKDPIPSVDLRFGDVSVSCHLDTGSSHGINLSMAAAKQLKITDKMQKIGQARTISRVFDIYEAPYQGQMQLAGNVIPNPRLTVVDMRPSGGNVGVGFMGDYAVTFDTKSMLVQFVKGDLAWRPAPPKRYGFQIAMDRETGGMALLGVEPGSPAEKAGFQKGDRLIKFNGKNLKGMPQDELRTLLRQPELLVDIERDGKPMQVKVRLE